MFKIGDRVKIISFERTDRAYGMDDLMFEMIGSVRKVTEADTTSVRVGGYYWRNEDVCLDEEIEKDPQIFLFDTSQLEGV